MAKFSMNFFKRKSFMTVQFPEVDIFLGVIQKGKCSSRQSPGQTLFRGADFPRGNFPGGKFSGNSFPEDNFLGGNFPGVFTCLN